MPYSTFLAKEDDPQALLQDNGWCAEEMLDGRVLLISKFGSVVRACTRDRVEHPLPPTVMNMAHAFPGDFIIEGHLVRDSFIASDILNGSGVMVFCEAFALRRKLLTLISPFPLAAHATGEQGKTQLLQTVRAACGAGVVFKRLDALHESGEDVYGMRFNNYRSGVLRGDDVSIEKRRAGSVGGGKPQRPRLLVR